MSGSVTSQEALSYSTLGYILRGNTQAPVNQSGQKEKEVKVTGKKAEESTLQYIREAVAWEQRSLFCFNHYVPNMVDRSCLAAG